MDYTVEVYREYEERFQAYLESNKVEHIRCILSAGYSIWGIKVIQSQLDEISDLPYIKLIEEAAMYYHS